MKYYDSRFILYSVYPLTKKGEEEEKGETYNPVDYHRVKKELHIFGFWSIVRLSIFEFVDGWRVPHSTDLLIQWKEQ